jgi:hypothetical protein
MENLRQFQWLIIAVLLAVAIVVAAVILRPHPEPGLQTDPREVACIQSGGQWMGGGICFHS